MPCADGVLLQENPPTQEQKNGKEVISASCVPSADAGLLQEKAPTEQEEKTKEVISASSVPGNNGALLQEFMKDLETRLHFQKEATVHAHQSASETVIKCRTMRTRFGIPPILKFSFERRSQLMHFGKHATSKNCIQLPRRYCQENDPKQSLWRIS